MMPPQLCQSNVASLPPPPETEIASWLESPPALSPLSNLQPLDSKEPVPFAPTEITFDRPAPRPTGTVLARALARRLDTYINQLRHCQRDFSETSVHELRVATRRLIAQFVLLSCITPGASARKACRLLKRRLKALGKLRDTHVQRLLLERQLTRFPELLLVRDFLQRQERRLERAAAAKVTGFKARKLEKWATDLSEFLVANAGSGRRSARMTAAIERATAGAFGDVVRCRQAIVPTEAANVHRTRLAFKKFRYMVESLSPELTGLGKRELRALAHYQRRMGLLQDLEITQHCLNDYMQQNGGTEDLLRPFGRYLRSRRARALRSFLKEADRVFEFWPPNGNGSCSTNGSSRLKVES
jgi:CHAD domain-containing protein